MNGLATFVMRGRTQAVLVASVFALTAMLLPFLSYLSGAVIALVTLRRGANEGAFIMLITAAIVAAFSQAVLDNVIFVLAFIVGAWLPVWILSLVLRRTISLQMTLWTAAAISLVLLFGIHAAIPDPVVWWREILEKMLNEALAQSEMGLAVAEINEILDSMAKLMTGFLAAAFFLSLVFSVCLGRWWQAMLYNPGGFRQEFLGIKLNRPLAVVAVVVFAWAMLSAGGTNTLPGDLSTLAITAFSIPGLALMHVWVEKSGAHQGWLIAMYVMLAIIPPQAMAGLAVAAIGDAWLDFRKYFVKRS